MAVPAALAFDGPAGPVAAHLRGLMTAGSLPSRTTLLAVYVLVGVAVALSCVAVVLAARAASRTAFGALSATHVTITGDAAWPEALLVTYPNPVSAYADDTAGVRIEMPQGSSTTTGQRGVVTSGPTGSVSLPS